MQQWVEHKFFKEVQISFKIQGVPGRPSMSTNNAHDLLCNDKFPTKITENARIFALEF
jgi:hypothetical protein